MRVLSLLVAVAPLASGFAPAVPMRARHGLARRYLSDSSSPDEAKVEPAVEAVSMPPKVEAAPVATKAPEAPKAKPAKAAAMPESSAIVPINEENVETSAGVLGAAAGLVLSGPPVAAALAITANFVSKQESGAGKTMRAAGEAGIQVYNFLSSTDEKYGITDKAGSALSSALDSAKEKDTSDDKVVSKAITTVNSVIDKAKELNQDLDITGNLKELVWATGELGGKAIEKGLELNDKYKVSDKVVAAVQNAVDKARENLKN